MNYKKTIAVCIMSFALATSGVYAAQETADTAAQSESTTATIVAGMNFVGPAKSLSLEDALKEMTTTSPAAKIAELNKKSSQNSSKSNAETISSMNSALKSIRGVAMVDLGFAESDVDMLKATKTFTNEQTEPNYQTELNKITSDTVSTYFQTLQAEDAVRINKENLATQKKILQNAQKKFDLGVVAKTEVMTAETAVIKAESDLLASENLYKTARMGLNVSMGYDLMQDVKLTSKLAKIDNQITPLVEGIKSGLDKRNEIKGSDFALEIAEMNLASILYRYPSHSATYIGKEIAVIEAKDACEQAVKGIELDIRSKYMAVDEKAKAINYAKSSLDNMKETSRIAQLSYDLGNSTMTDVQEAQVGVFSLEVAYSQAILDYNLAVYDYEFAIGYGITTIPLGSSGN